MVKEASTSQVTMQQYGVAADQLVRSVLSSEGRGGWGGGKLRVKEFKNELKK